MRKAGTALPAMRPSSEGFTLIELMVSIGIIIFVVSVTMIAFGPLMKSGGLKTASRTVRTVLEGARIRAIQQHRRVRFEAQLVLSTEANARQWTVTSNASDPLPEWIKLPEFVSINTTACLNDMSVEFSGTLVRLKMLGVTFGPDGTVVRTAVTTIDNNGAEASPDPTDNPTDLFKIRLTNLRESAQIAPADMYMKSIHREVQVIPLTGGSLTVDETGEVY